MILDHYILGTHTTVLSFISLWNGLVAALNEDLAVGQADDVDILRSIILG